MNIIPKVRRLQVLAVCEAVSLIVLVTVAMPLKYLAHMPAATRVVGMVHGLAFVAYVATLVDAFGARHLTGKEALLSFAAAFIHGGTFIVARRLNAARDT
jgi:integral membrane protein